MSEAKRPGARRALSETDILDAALALLDAGGPDAASIRCGQPPPAPAATSSTSPRRRSTSARPTAAFSGNNLNLQALTP